MEQNNKQLNNIKNNQNMMAVEPVPVPMMILSSVGQEEIARRVRLRPVKSEKEHYFKLMNITWIRRFVIIQAIASAITILAQVLLYAVVTESGRFKVIDYSGIAIWGPLLFFSTAIILSWLSTKSPSGCIIGSALGFEITTTVISCIATTLGIISLVDHGRYVYNRHSGSYEYVSNEVPGRIISSLLVLAVAVVLILSIFLSILFCRVSCCCKKKYDESTIFHVEVVI